MRKNKYLVLNEHNKMVSMSEEEFKALVKGGGVKEDTAKEEALSYRLTEEQEAEAEIDRKVAEANKKSKNKNKDK